MKLTFCSTKSTDSKGKSNLAKNDNMYIYIYTSFFFFLQVYKKAITEKKGLFLECDSCGHNQIHQEMDKALMNIHL